MTRYIFILLLISGCSSVRQKPYKDVTDCVSSQVRPSDVTTNSVDLNIRCGK